MLGGNRETNRKAKRQVKYAFLAREGRICPSFYEKTHKKCIFFAKHLVNSKKSSTFAPLFRRRVKGRGKKYERPASLAQLARARDL